MVLLDAGILTLNGTFVAQLIIFLVTLVVLYRFAWGPILKVLDERKRRIQEGIEAADRAQREREAAEAEYQSKLDEARREGQALIEKVTQQSDQLRKELEAKAR
ncbi:MAG: ATP synthase F0 subunit B, partial [Candidatus Dormibacteraeota bacterium]|nr:ATP synthase F0 subunit B [Candidatus Dormibacteraeota bacterium]